MLNVSSNICWRIILLLQGSQSNVFNYGESSGPGTSESETAFCVLLKEAKGKNSFKAGMCEALVLIV